MTIVQDFLTLFRGRGDAYGSWEGGCVREKVNEDTFLRHLTGEEKVGIYPCVPNGDVTICAWGCSDIDVDDLDAARNLQTALLMKNVYSWVEKTRKGYHVWVFATVPVKAATMRRALLAAHEACNYPAKEVNPKQENTGTKLGNYVRLPYPGELTEPCAERFVLDGEENRMELAQFVSRALANRATPDTLESVAQMYRPPVMRSVAFDAPIDEVAPLLKRIPALPFIIWRDGPIEGGDRSTTLYRLAHRLSETDLSPTEAFSIVRNADMRWGKFHLRPDGDKEIEKMIRRAFGVVSGF